MPAKLPTRKIGTTDVTAIGWGAMGLSVGYGTVPPDEERLKVCIWWNLHVVRVEIIEPSFWMLCMKTAA